MINRPIIGVYWAMQNFYLKPTPGQRVETQLTVQQDNTATIFGRIHNTTGAPLPTVLVLLFQEGKDSPIAQCESDLDGHFAFGGLPGNTLYQVKVFPPGPAPRVLEFHDLTSAPS